jgi:hypothetical protein
MSFSKRLEEARRAYEKGNATAAVQAHAHQAISKAPKEHGGTASQYI